MAHSRIDDLRRRVEADPASIAFAQLAEEYRRAGQTEEAVRVCREGLTRHPGYLSARVTLGRALLDLGQLEEARTELQFVATEAPENLAAVRGLAEIFHREGDAASALEYFQRALSLAPHDPDLEEIVQQLSRQVGAEEAPSNGLSFEEAHQELVSAADRLPLAPAAAEQAPVPTEAGGSTAPFDFDTLVAALGTPAAPPLVEAVARGETPEVFELPELPPLGADPFAALEAELRAQVEPAGTETTDPPAAPSASTDESTDVAALETSPESPEDGAEAPRIAPWPANTLDDVAADAPSAEPEAPRFDADVVETPAPADTDATPLVVTSPETEADSSTAEAGAPPLGVPAAIADFADALATSQADDSATAPAEAPAADATTRHEVDTVAGEEPGDTPAAPAEPQEDQALAEARDASEPAPSPEAEASPVRPATGDDVLGDLESWLNTLQDRSDQ